MPAFYRIAVPHKDILTGNMTLETYAAKLLDVYDGKGPTDYVDPKAFFERTYETKNLSSIVTAVKNRLDGQDVDHFHPIQTRFGGGKTHTLIYLYHKYVEWHNKKPIVIVGTALDPNSQTIWGEIEKQLTGHNHKLTGMVSRGSLAIKSLLEPEQPVLILIDELLHYVGRADGIEVGNTTLAEQTIAFIQELGEAVIDLKNVCVVVTLPSSANEQINNEKAEILFEKLKNFAGRIADVVSPVDDAEIPNIIRRRLFETSDAEIINKSSSVINEFVTYCDSEGILPEGIDKAAYRKQFEQSYPFQPQVIDVLYKRWGSLQTFQRTRGVLRLLSIVTHDMLKSEKSFICLSDFDLENGRLREELTQYLDDQFQSVIAQDIVGPESGARKVDLLMPSNLIPNKLGTRTASAIFMYSHSGSHSAQDEQRGASAAEIMRSTVDTEIPSANITSVLEKFRNHMFYLATHVGTYFFTKEANMLKMKLERMESISSDDVAITERSLLQRNISDARFSIYLWPTHSKMVKDTTGYKVVVLKKPDLVLMKSILHTVGELPRQYKNTLFFLTGSISTKNKFHNSIKSQLAWEYILKRVELRNDQRRTLNEELKSDTDKSLDFLKEYYSHLYVPVFDDLRKSPDEKATEPSLEMHEIVVPIYTSSRIDQILYDYLKQESLYVEELGPEFIRENYMKNQRYVSTHNLYVTMLTSPGETRPASQDVLSRAIYDGVIKKLFGLGTLESDVPIVTYFGDKKNPLVTFSTDEIIVASTYCSTNKPEPIICDICGSAFSDHTNLKDHMSTHTTGPQDSDTSNAELKFTFTLPTGTAHYVGDMLLLIADKFKDIDLTVRAKNGKIIIKDIENLKETLRQMKSSSDLFQQHDGD